MSGNSTQVNQVQKNAKQGTGASSEDAIFIRSSAASNGITTLLVGGLVALVGAAVISFLPPLFFLVGILFLSGSTIAFVMGFYKLREPQYSLEITKQAIIYYHRKGQWMIPWENIQRFDVPRIRKGLEHVELEMVGFRLREPENFLSDISPRLVTHLLMEQRPLVAQLIANNCNSGQCYGDDIMEDTKYKCSDGSMLSGVTAMFANRMKKLQQGLGYDIFLSVNDIDRDGKAFIALLRECHETVLTQQSHSPQ